MSTAKNKVEQWQHVLLRVKICWTISSTYLPYMSNVFLFCNFCTWCDVAAAVKIFLKGDQNKRIFFVCACCCVCRRHLYEHHAIVIFFGFVFVVEFFMTLCEFMIISWLPISKLLLSKKKVVCQSTSANNKCTHNNISTIMWRAYHH